MEFSTLELLPTTTDAQEYTRALFVLCERMYSVGRYDDAEQLAFELRMLHPQDTRMYKLSAAIQAGKNNYLFAYNCYWGGILVDDKDPELWIGLGQSAIHLDRINDAIVALDQTMALAKKDQEIYEHARRLRNLIQ